MIRFKHFKLILSMALLDVMCSCFARTWYEFFTSPFRWAKSWYTGDSIGKKLSLVQLPLTLNDRLLNILFVAFFTVVMAHEIHGFSLSISKEIYEDKQILYINVKDIPSMIAVMQNGTGITHLSARILLSSEQHSEKIECETTINNKPIEPVLLENTKVDKYAFDYIFHTFYNAFNGGVPAQLEKDVPVTVKKKIGNIDTFNKESDVWRSCLYALIKLINSNETQIAVKVPFLIGMISKPRKYFNIVLDTHNFPRLGEKKTILLEVAYKMTRIAGGDYFDTEIDPKNSFVSLVSTDKVSFTSISDWNLYRILLQLCDKFISHYFDTRKYKMATGKLILNTKNNYKVEIDDRVYGGTWKSQEIDLIRFTYDLANSLESNSVKKEVTQNTESSFLTWLRLKVASWRWW